MTQIIRKLRNRRGRRGQAVVELALAAPLLAFLLVAATDFARVFFLWIELNNAARAGVQYGAQSLIFAADATGMKSAAANDALDITGMTTTASQCTCISGSSVPVCGAGYCSVNTNATFVKVDTQATFQTLFHYPGIPPSTTISGQAIMQVSASS